MHSEPAGGHLLELDAQDLRPAQAERDVHVDHLVSDQALGHSLRIEASGDKMTGMFIEHHAPGPAIDFSAERGWNSEPKPYNGVAGARPRKDASAVQDERNGAKSPLLCDCANYH